MSAVDWVLLVLLLGSLALGAWRGLVFEVLSLAGWVLALLAARAAVPWLADALPMGALPPPLRLGAAFLGVFVATLFAAGILAALARKLVSSVGLRPVDRVLGAGFGALRALLLLALLALVVNLLGLRQPLGWAGTRGGQVLDDVLLAIQPWLPPALYGALPPPGPEPDPADPADPAVSAEPRASSTRPRVDNAHGAASAARRAASLAPKGASALSPRSVDGFRFSPQ